MALLQIINVSGFQPFASLCSNVKLRFSHPALHRLVDGFWLVRVGKFNYEATSTYARPRLQVPAFVAALFAKPEVAATPVIASAFDLDFRAAHIAIISDLSFLHRRSCVLLRTPSRELRASRAALE